MVGETLVFAATPPIMPKVVPTTPTRDSGAIVVVAGGGGGEVEEATPEVDKMDEGYTNCVMRMMLMSSAEKRRR